MFKARDRTLADFIAGVLTLPLVMTLIGSLVFFLLEVFYQGDYSSTLKWVLFFFVFGAVLIARIGQLNDIKGRAGVYAIVLGGLVWLVLAQHFDYTDDARIAEKKGLINFLLMALIGWSAHQLIRDCTLTGDAPLDSIGLFDVGRDEDPAPSRRRLKKAKPGLSAWWQRLTDYWQERSKKRPQGRWILYFSLAALPLFGLGQGRIVDVGRRDDAFRLMVLYVGSGLGLLLTTSFLSLRRHLAERKVAMPWSVTTTWMFGGTALIVGLLFACKHLPMPDPDPVQKEWAGIQSKREGGQSKPEPAALKDSPSETKEGKAEGKKPPTPKPPPESDPEPESRADQFLKSIWYDLLEWLIKVGRWLVIAVLVVIGGFWGLRAIMQFLANFSLWAGRWLDWLNGLGREKNVEDEVEAAESLATPRAFASFRDPFESGQAEHWSPTELVRYSFAALEAWARERKLPRNDDETPFEFARMLAKRFPETEREVEQLANLYSRLAYSPDSVGAKESKGLQKFWEMLEYVSEGLMAR